jgi:hypothetical protein
LSRQRKIAQRYKQKEIIMMNHTNGWMNNGWMNGGMGGGMWLWTVIGVLVVVLLGACPRIWNKC